MSDGMILRYGTHKPLEEVANEILRQSLSGITAHSEKKDILTPWKDQDRRRREVYTSTGTPDGALRRGNFHRSLNPSAPHLNSAEGFTPTKQQAQNARSLETGRFGTSSPWDDE